MTTSRRFVLPFVTRDCDHVTNALPPFGQWVQGQISLSTAFQAERMFPLYIYSTTHTAQHKEDEPARIHPLFYIMYCHDLRHGSRTMPFLTVDKLLAVLDYKSLGVRIDTLTY